MAKTKKFKSTLLASNTLAGDCEFRFMKQIGVTLGIKREWWRGLGGKSALLNEIREEGGGGIRIQSDLHLIFFFLQV